MEATGISLLADTMKTIYKLNKMVQNNKKQCSKIGTRLEALENLVLSIQKEVSNQLPADTNEALQKLKETLTSADELIEEYDEAHKLKKIFKSCDYESKFKDLDKSLMEDFMTLSATLLAYLKKMQREQEKMQREQEKMQREQEKMQREQEKMQTELEKMQKKSDCIIL
ncbi:golgin subfamily A member 6-like protein 6 [Lates calcarifer]|uniref:Golgin subfamily A member 6-like protein 6 n=1 Tax=Lates calcarifer TaxID=8187 RepID=A0AAJ8BAS8_LATCA|nr:golgin subfamily A member 6-like protein 6 [Lates calcarifer]